MIEIYTGKTGSGKSLRLADQIMATLARNQKWYEKNKGRLPRRKISTNLKLSKQVIHWYGDFIEEWQDPADLITKENCDIFWDEISTHLDSTQWKDCPLELKRFLQQHRKRGIEIYGTTQNFKTIDISMRRIVDYVWQCQKILGSRNPSPTLPPLSAIWGLIWLREIEPETFEKEEFKYIGFDWLWISRGLVGVYDTRQEIEAGKYPPLRHIERVCNDPKCKLHKVIHV